MSKQLPFLLLSTVLLLSPAAYGKIEYVLHITMDGMRADALHAALNHPDHASSYPGFRRLLAEGAATFHARCDFDYSETLPNHTGMFTGRPVFEPPGLLPAPFTASADTDTLTAPAHGLRPGDNVMLATGDTLPAGLEAGTAIYRVFAVTADTFRLALYDTGTGTFPPVDITGDGNGQHTFVRRESHGFSANFPAAVENIHKLGTAPLAYKDSTFDTVHDRGFSTAFIAGKSRMNLFVQSYGPALGAADTVGADQGRGKLDHINVTNVSAQATMLAVAQAAVARITGGTLNHYTFVHFTDTDTGAPGGGHSVTWNSAAWIEYGTKVVDSYLLSILDAIAANDTYRGRVAIVITADHGGGQTNGVSNAHTDASAFPNYNIPLFVWGPGIAGNTDAYALFKNRTHPGAARPNSAPATPQPLRNTDSGNIAMTLLGLPPVTGSYFRPEFQHDLHVTNAGGSVRISWPLYLTGHILHESTDLTAGWTPVTVPPVETAGRFEVSLPADEGPRRFWVLRPPQ